MNQRGADIPGLFSSDQSKANIDWSSDNIGQEQSRGQDPAANDQNQNSMIMLGSNSLLGDLTVEKDNHCLVLLIKKLPK